MKKNSKKDEPQQAVPVRNAFTQAEFVAYKLQIWNITYTQAIQQNGTGSISITSAVESANEAIDAFDAKFGSLVVNS